MLGGYHVTFTDDNNIALAGTLEFLDINGKVLGSVQVPIDGVDIPDVPDGTVSYRAKAPGFKDLYGDSLVANTNFQLGKDEPILKYVLIGGAAFGLMYLLGKIWK